MKNWERSNNEESTKTHGSFAVTHGSDGSGYYFPLWYPALIFAFAGVAALRFRRQFTIRSAIIATTIVAGLLEMTVAL